MKVWVDNAGSVFIWKKGYSSSCRLSSTLVKAISCIAAALSCRLELEKITRCSCPLAVMADAPSKARFDRFWSTAYQNGGFSLGLDPAWIPVQLVCWIQNPCPDNDLGDRILAELATRTPVLGYSC